MASNNPKNAERIAMAIIGLKEITIREKKEDVWEVLNYSKNEVSVRHYGTEIMRIDRTNPDNMKLQSWGGWSMTDSRYISAIARHLGIRVHARIRNYNLEVIDY